MNRELNEIVYNHRLPSMDEYKATIVTTRLPQYSEPKFKCPECGGGMCMDNTVVLTTYPPKHKYVCDKCGHVVSF